MLDLGVYPLSWITSLIYKISGEFHFPRITSQMIKNKITGVDETTSAIFSYDSLQIQTILNSSIIYDSPSKVSIHGSKGSLVISGGIFCPKKVELTIRDEITVFDGIVEGNGLIHQADHFEECLRKGLKESSVMSHEESLLNMRITDEIRIQNSFLLDGEYLNHKKCIDYETIK